METLFLRLLELSLQAALLVAAVIVLRLLFRRAPKWLTCALWALVGLRLCCPFSIESRLSVVPGPATMPADILPSAGAVPAQPAAAAASVAAPQSISLNTVLAWVWLAGVLAMLLYAVASTLLLRRRMADAILCADGSRRTDRTDVPFVLGIFRPVIYLPCDLAAEDIPYILAHERAHIARLDHVWKPLGFALLALYWFNPVLWLAYILLCRDIEAACDERVIRNISDAGRRAYSRALLNCAVQRRVITACPLAFGEGRVKNRIRSVMNYRRPAFWIILLAVLASVLAAVCLLTTKPAPETPNVERPMLYMDGKYYIDPYMPESTLPAGYASAGRLTAAQANNTGLAGTEYYVNFDSFDYYTYQLCGTPTGLDEVDSENRQMAYLRWIPADFDAIAERRLTMDAVMLLAQKGSELTWTDFDRYVCEPTGYHFEALGDTPAVLRTYPIDKNYEVVIGGSSTDKAPEYILLRNTDVNAWVSLRTQNAEEFVAAYQPADTLPAAGDDATAEDHRENILNGELLFVNGILYENTGQESMMDARCGTMDGAVESTVEAGQVPTEERQSNFGTGYEFQYVTNEEIDVVIGGKWMVFRAVEPFPSDYFCQSTALEPYPPSLRLSNGWFTFRVSLFSDRIFYGHYSLTEDTLTLNAVEGESFVFDRTDAGFCFRAEASVPLPTFAYSPGADPQPPFGDGALFAP